MTMLRSFLNPGILLSGLLWLAACADQPAAPVVQPPPPPPPPHVMETAPVTEEIFASPDAAVAALVAATRADDKIRLQKILGPDSKDVIYSGDKIADRRSRRRFLHAYDVAHKLVMADDTHATLAVGEEEWPLPIPLVNNNNGWHFDTDKGILEILSRRIGRNELSAIEVCHAFVEAEQDYADQRRAGAGSNEYARYLVSHKGTHDGLYWHVDNSRTPSPLGPLIASAAAEGYSDRPLSKHTPYHGYFYKILYRQGTHAADGARDYVVDGHMTGGFALLAFPAKFGDSGIMSFIVNQNGIVYEKNLGADGTQLARQIDSYDPDESWDIVEDTQ